MTKKSVLLSLLLIIVLNCIAYGYSIQGLGYYLDDWSHLTPYRLNGYEGEGLSWYLLQDNRPGAGSFYQLAFQWLGYWPLSWHIFILVLRILTSLALYGLLWLCFPAWNRFSLFAVLFFSVFPTFKQTPTAIAYSVHWASLLLLFNSFLLTCLSIKKKIPASAGYFFSMMMAVGSFYWIEYFVPLELMRVFIIGICHWEKGKNKTRWAMQTAAWWAPYLLVLLAFFFWRFRFMPLAEGDRNYPLFYRWIKEPLEAIKMLSSFYLQDLYRVLIRDGIAAPATPLGFSLNKPFWMLLWVLLALPLSLGLKAACDDEKSNPDWKKLAAMMAIGLVAMGLGFLPGYATGENYGKTAATLDADRFALAAIPGAGIFFASLFELISYRNFKSIAAGIFLAGYTLFHVGNAIYCGKDTARLNDFIWQLNWRAPGLESQTPIYSEGDFFSKMGDWGFSLVINNTYLSSYQEHMELDYWYFDMDMGVPVDILDQELYKNFNVFRFWGLGRNGIAVSFSPEKSHCLWVLSPDDQKYSELSATGRQLAAISNLERVWLEPAALPPTEIFGPEPEHDWCYFYQKAALAAQHNRWEEVTALWDESARVGEVPLNSFEMKPFIQAFARSGQLDSIRHLIGKANQQDPATADFLCGVIKEETAKIKKEVSLETLGCHP